MVGLEVGSVVSTTIVNALQSTWQGNLDDHLHCEIFTNAIRNCSHSIMRHLLCLKLDHYEPPCY